MRREIRPEMTQHPLAKAAREIDLYTETHSFRETCEHYDLEADDLMYVAEQRALRALFPNINWKAKTDPEAIPLTQQQVSMHIALSAVAMDAFAIGWRAREIAKEEANDDRSPKS